MEPPLELDDGEDDVLEDVDAYLISKSNALENLHYLINIFFEQSPNFIHYSNSFDADMRVAQGVAELPKAFKNFVVNWNDQEMKVYDLLVVELGYDISLVKSIFWLRATQLGRAKIDFSIASRETPEQRANAISVEQRLERQKKKQYGLKVPYWERQRNID